MLTLQPTTKPHLLDYICSRSRGTGFYRNNKDVVNLARNYSPFLYRLNLMKTLPVHTGCVNTICWNKTGEYLLSGSDDCNLCITKPACMFDTSKTYTVLHKVQTRHLGNIFCARFLPNYNDSLIVSCSTHGPVIVHDINLTDLSQGIYNFNCHASTIFEVVTLHDDDRVFLTCGEDKTLRLTDLRCHRSCTRSSTCPHPPLIRNSHAMTTLDVHPTNSNLLLVGRADGLGLVYDRRKLPNPTGFSHGRTLEHLDSNASVEYSSGNSSQVFKYLHPLEGVVSQFTVPHMEEKCRFTTLCYSSDGRQVLASYSQDYIYLFDHDKSSNFQLIQTLPKKFNDSNDDFNNNTNSNNSETHNPGRSNAEPQLRRTSRNIRVRGDWSDTGVNSVPLAARPNQQPSQPTNQPNSRSSLLQGMSDVAFTLNSRGGLPRFVSLSELIAREFNASRANRTDRSDNRTDEQIEPVVFVRNIDTDNEEEVDDDDDDDIDGDQGEEDDDDEDHDHDMEVVEDLDPSTTVRLHVNLDIEVENETDEEEEDSTPKKIETNKSNQSEKSNPSKTGVSSRSKLKFKESLAALKNRFGKIPTHQPRVKYQGHRNCKTFIKKAIFWGDDYIMSGSDCGRIIIWEKETAKLVMAFQADERVVNCLAPNPHHYVLASSGIDYDIKLWSTQNILDCPLKVSQVELDKIVSNNEMMLEEAKHTLVVPPNLFFRVLASFAENHNF